MFTLAGWMRVCPLHWSIMSRSSFMHFVSCVTCSEHPTMTELYIKTDISVNPFGIKVNSFLQVHRLYTKFAVIKS